MSTGFFGIGVVGIKTLEGAGKNYSSKIGERNQKDAKA